MGENERVGSGPTGIGAYWLGGLAGGLAAGILIAYGESLFILLTAGSFWADWRFLLKAMLLYGLLGGALGGLGGAFLHAAFFRRHPLRRLPPGIFFFSIFTAAGIFGETWVFLMDIHTFRTPQGRWQGEAYLVLLAGLAAAVLAGGWIAWSGGRIHGKGKKPVWRWAAVVLLVAVAVWLAANALAARQEGPGNGKIRSGPEGRPANVVILLVDALRPDHLSAYGHALPTSPTIDRLAREGVLFRTCYATSTWSIPTHASIFTGLFPSSHGAYTLYSALDPEIPTLAQILAARGYRTASLFDNPLLGKRYGLTHGFQTALGVDNAHKVSLAVSRIRDRLRGVRSMSPNILGVAASWIDHAGRQGRPFFLFMNLMDVHLPYRPKEPYAGEFLRSLPPGKVDKDLVRRFTGDGILSKKAADALFPRLGAADWRWLERIYDSNIRFVDDQIGRFLDRLRRRGQLENTLVIVTADHGELFGENGLGAHFQPSMHHASMRIPLIFWFPARLPAAEVVRPVSQVDMFAAILKLAGFPHDIPAHVQGEDLFAPPDGRGILGEFWDEERRRFIRSYYSGDFKLMVQASGKRELFDLKTDAAEARDLAPLRPELLRELSARLDAQLNSMPRRAARADPGKRREMERMLRSLGYL